MSKRFLTCKNNGTVGVVLEDDLKKLSSREDLYGLGRRVSGVTVFTFCSPHRMQEEPEAKFIFTGDYGLMERLLHGHDVREGGFHVPFSNGAERGVHGEEEKARELEWRTTTQEVVDTFLS